MREISAAQIAVLIRRVKPETDSIAFTSALKLAKSLESGVWRLCSRTKLSFPIHQWIGRVAVTCSGRVSVVGGGGGGDGGVSKAKDRVWEQSGNVWWCSMIHHIPQ